MVEYHFDLGKKHVIVTHDFQRRNSYWKIALQKYIFNLH